MAARLLTSDRGPDGLQAASDYKESGLQEVNLFVMFTVFMVQFSAVGALIAFGVTSYYPPYEKIHVLKTYELGPVYLGIFFLRYCVQMINANLGQARRPTRCNVPDQHVYRVYGGPADGALVLMNDAEPFGSFNRAQRALANMEEYLPMFLVQMLVVGFVFPISAAILAGIFGLSRVFAAVSYTRDRKARTIPTMISYLALGILDGMGLYIGFKTILY